MPKPPPPGDRPPITASEEFHAWKDPRYVAANAKLQELRRKSGEVEQRIQAECSRRELYRRSTRQQAEAEALVFGTELAAECGSEDLARLQHERQVLESAIGIAERHRDQVEAAVSREIIQKALPEYHKILRRAYAAAQPLAAIYEEEARFVEALVENGTQLGVLQRVIPGGSPGLMVARIREEALYHYGLEL